MKKPIEPTAGESANGWTAPKLAAYVESRNAAASKIIGFDPNVRPAKQRPTTTNSKYNPKRPWR